MPCRARLGQLLGARAKRSMKRLCIALGVLAHLLWFTVVATTAFEEWDRLPRPSGWFVEPVDVKTGRVLSEWEVNENREARRAPTVKEIDDLIALVRHNMLHPVFASPEPAWQPSARDRLFGITKPSPVDPGWLKLIEDEQTKRDRRRQFIEDYVESTSNPVVKNPAIRDAALAEITKLPVSLVRAQPMNALLLVRLTDFRYGEVSDHGYTPWPLDPPAEPRLKWQLFAAILGPLAVAWMLADYWLKHRAARRRSA